MRRTKDAITDFAIAKGYDGDKPKTIAGAVDALAGVAGGGGAGGAAGYSYSSTATDLVHEQTVNIIAGTGDQEGQYFSPIVVDTQACAGVDGIMDDDGARGVCQIDGKEYTAFMGGNELDGDISYYFEMYDGEPTPIGDPGPIVMPVASIRPDEEGNYTIATYGTEVVGLGNHVVRIYYASVDATFELPFINALKDAMGISGGGDTSENNAFVVTGTRDAQDNSKWTLDHTPEEVRQAYNDGKRIFLDLDDRERMSAESIGFAMDGAGGTVSNTFIFYNDNVNISSTGDNPTNFYLNFTEYKATYNGMSTVLVITLRSYMVTPTSIQKV
jgi:hypothetical protein